jgi:hypothetical protein
MFRDPIFKLLAAGIGRRFSWRGASKRDDNAAGSRIDLDAISARALCGFDRGRERPPARLPLSFRRRGVLADRESYGREVNSVIHFWPPVFASLCCEGLDT